MYNLLFDNIISSANGIMYIYELETYNTELTTNKDDLASTNHVTKIINKINRPGEIFVLPEIINPNELILDRYNNFIDKTNDSSEDFINLKKQYTKEVYQQLSTTEKYVYRTFIGFVQSNKKLGSKKNLLHFNSNEKKYSKKELEFINNTNQSIYEQIKKINPGVEKVSSDRTLKLLNYLKVPTEKDLNDYIVNVESSMLNYEFETKNGKYENKSAKLMQISSFPKKRKKEFNFINNIKNMRFPVDIIIKFDIEQKNYKYEKKMRSINHELIKSQKDYVRDYSTSLQEYEEKMELARGGMKEFQSNEAFLIEYQVTLRLWTSSPKVDALHKLNKRYEQLNKMFSSQKIQLVSALGRQEILANHILPLEQREAKYINKVSGDYFSKLNLLSGFKIGNETETALLQLYKLPTWQPVMIDDFAVNRGETKVTAPVTAYFGTTGSGKSQLVNNVILSKMIMLDSKTLFIDPKGDRKDYALKFDPELNMDKFITEVCIGKNARYKGTMDYFTRYEILSDNENNNEILDDLDDISTLSISVVSFIKKLLTISGKSNYFDNPFIVNTINEYVKKCTNLSMVGYLNFIKQDNNLLASELLAFENQPYANLFFGSEKNKNVLSFDNKINLIILDSISSADTTLTMEEELFNLAYRELIMFVKDFMRNVDGNFDIVLEELSYLKEQTSTSLDTECSRLVRSFGGYLHLVLQNPSDTAREVLNNIGTVYFGGMANDDEFNFIASNWKIPRERLTFLEFSNDSKTKKESDKYAFMTVTNDNNKAKVKQKILPMFSGAFNTQKEKKYE